MHRGYILEWRKCLDSEIWQMPPLYDRVWKWLVLSANHKAREVNTPKGQVFLKPGQRITSMRQIADGVSWTEWGVVKTPSPKTILMILEWLQSKEMVTVESNSKGTLVSVTNWHIYQNVDSAEVTAKKHCLPTNNNGKNEKNKNHPHLSNGLEIFEECWEAYPRKLGKAAAWNHFKAQIKTVDEARMLFDAIVTYSKLVAGKEEQYIKHGSGFFNNLWRDYAERHFDF